MPLELKICGINSENIIKTIVKCGGCQYLGFVFYKPSPRNLSIEKSKKLTSIIPCIIKHSIKAKYFLSFKFVLQCGQINFFLNTSSSMGLEHAGQIKPSKSETFIFISYPKQEIYLKC